MKRVNYASSCPSLTSTRTSNAALILLLTVVAVQHSPLIKPPKQLATKGHMTPQGTDTKCRKTDMSTPLPLTKLPRPALRLLPSTLRCRAEWSLPMPLPHPARPTLLLLATLSCRFRTQTTFSLEAMPPPPLLPITTRLLHLPP